MASVIGYTNYSNIRVNSIDTTSEKDEFSKWMHGPNFRAIKSSTAQAVENKTTEKATSFSSLLKQAEQDNNLEEKVELRPDNRLANISNLNIDILA